MWKFDAKLISTTLVSGFDGIDHLVAEFEINIIPPGECGFFYYIVGNSILGYLEQIRLLHIFDLYSRGLYVLPLAAQLPTNRSFTEILSGTDVNVRIICTYFLIVSAMVNDFDKYLVHKSFFIALRPKVFCYVIWSLILQRLIFL